MNFLQSTINKEINKRKNVYKRAAETDSSDVKKVKKYVTVAQIQEQENRLRAEKEEAGEMENERKSVEVKKEHKEEIVIPIEQKPNRIEVSVFVV
ncbi:hypothetical protein AX774_g4552 [Zancudomyces culisetae]|uniref:Uncharacterized protein n=1 Tax=Zancudomyces culisetae TaxID=1213189 RepID=A0A1R1PLY4_ZANCU|nr:hypothetical protein AX774_g4552 [Zancudomyces culisetae]|eukprot:OMH81980.1 hypothetical protein AX774_g4552 [Zancudomyces culisetae]